MESSTEVENTSLLNVTEFQKIFGHYPNRDKYMIRLGIIGYPGTGKTAFIKRFCDQVFPTEHKPSMNIELTSEVIRVNNSVIIEVFLYEVAGQTQYIELKNLFVCGLQGVIVMYAAHYEYSFRKLEYLMTFMDKNLMCKVPILVVGNSFEGSEKVVTGEQVQNLCKKFGCDHLSIDAKRFSNSVDKCIGYFISKLIEGVDI